MTAWRALTLNVWGTNGPVARRMANLADHLRRSEDDVVALQEVAGHRDATQAHALAQAAGLPFVDVVRTARGPRGEGLAVLTSLEARGVARVALPGGGGDPPRALQLVDVVTPGGTTVRVANTHLAWRLDATSLRVAQALAVVAALQDFGGPCLLLGDLNDTPGSPPLEVLADAGLVDCYAALHATDRWTFDPANPYVWQPELVRRRVDHVLARGLEALGADVVFTGQDAPIVSDHFGVRVHLDEPAGA